MRYTPYRNAPTDKPAMIALAILAAALANVTLVVILADRFGSESDMHTSAGELTGFAAAGRPKNVVTLANENTSAAATQRAA